MDKGNRKKVLRISGNRRRNRGVIKKIYSKSIRGWGVWYDNTPPGRWDVKSEKRYAGEIKKKRYSGKIKKRYIAYFSW